MAMIKSYSLYSLISDISHGVERKPKRGLGYSTKLSMFWNMCFDEKLNKWVLFKKFLANFVLTSNLEPEGNATGNLTFISFWAMFTGAFQKTECPDPMYCICSSVRHAIVSSCWCMYNFWIVQSTHLTTFCLS
jgi:hypothetical protein